MQTDPDRGSVASVVVPRCGVRECEAVPRYVVGVFHRDSDGTLWHEIDTYACEAHAARRGVLKLGELVPCSVSVDSPA